MSRKMVLKKYGSIFIVCILLVGLLSGCGMREKDAKAYVTATLDASYKGKFEEYKKQTDATEKEVKNLYQENIGTMMQSSGLDSIGASEKMTEKFRLLFQDILKAANYKVQSAEKTDNGFAVKVKVKPLKCFSGLQDELTKKLEAKMKTLKKIPSDDKLNELMLQEMYDIMADKLKNPEYGKAEVRKVQIEKDDDGVYSIREKDLTSLDAAMFPM